MRRASPPVTDEGASAMAAVDGNLYHLFRLSDPERAEATLLETADGRRWRYAEVHSISGQMAELLRRQGLAKGDLVAAQVEKSPAALCLYLACLRAGLIYLPLNTAYTADELDYFLTDARPGLVVCDPARAGDFERMSDRRGAVAMLTLDGAGRGSLTEGAARLPDRFADAAVAADDVAAVLYTSGTTGRPKGALITHGNLCSSAQALARRWAFGEEDVLLHALPMFHGHGLFVSSHCVLVSGASMLFLPRFDAAEVCRLLPRTSVMMGVPTFYGRLLEAPGFGADLCGGIRLFISGSAPLPLEVSRRFRERTGRDIIQRYGATETAICTCAAPDRSHRPDSVGAPLPGIELRVVDEHLAPLPANATGRVQVRGPNLFKGYWNRPEATAAAFTDDGFFKTGDLGFMDDSGELVLVDRETDLIISGGYNVYPKEVETVLERNAAVAEAAVFGVPHPDFGEGVAAAVVRAPAAGSAPSPREQDLIDYAREHLAAYKTPKRIVFVDALPRNRLGKIQKNVLKQRHHGLFSGSH